jgi:hypothetical protein
VTPTQKGYPYDHTHDHDGQPEAEEHFFAFDVQAPEGHYWDKVILYREPLIHQLVPVIYQGPYDAAKIKALAEGKTFVSGAKHIREGIVICSATERQVCGLGRAQLKLKSMKFLERENA